MTRVYFTWPDDRFRYQCAGCGACCKGHGIGIDVAGGQLVKLVARRPELVGFLRRRGDAITAFNPRDRCWFLADDGLCRVETEDGRDAKPASCRLFPFNRVFRIGDVLVVDYNSVICPLQTGATGERHADVVREIEGIADPAIVGTPLPSQNAAAEATMLVEGEGAIARALFAAADANDVVAGWASQADAAAYERECALATDAFTAILGTPWRAPIAVANALWVTPSLRFNELYGPRQYASRANLPPVLARMWLAWLGFAALGEHLAQRALSIQELTTIWSEQAPLLHAIARWSDAPSLKPGPVELPGVDPGGLVRGLAQAFIDNRKTKKSLGQLVAALPADPVQRALALKSSEALLRSAYRHQT